MGLFDMFKKDVASTDPNVAADAAGTVVPMEKISDGVFSEGVLGPCCGIEPLEGKVFAPVDGKIDQVADTRHAIGLTGANGVEILIHVGLDTVDMNGDGFAPKVKIGDRVKQGQLIMTMDLDKIKAAGHPTVVITVVTNGDDLGSVELAASGSVTPGDVLFKIEK